MPRTSSLLQHGQAVRICWAHKQHRWAARERVGIPALAALIGRLIQLIWKKTMTVMRYLAGPCLSHWPPFSCHAIVWEGLGETLAFLAPKRRRPGWSLWCISDRKVTLYCICVLNVSISKESWDEPPSIRDSGRTKKGRI